jgi:ATP-dependent DNA ligase
LLQRGANGVAMFSKSGENLARYFPEILESAAQLREEHFCLDGELVIPIGDRFSFGALLQRIHPAASRVKRMAAETPALFLAFDLLRRGARISWRRPCPSAGGNLRLS